MTSEPRGAASETLAWEAAYRRFESAEEEVRKFERRLGRLGAGAWPRDSRVLELFCGRAHGLVALERMGFRRLVGGDLSTALLSEYRGPGALFTADARALPLASGSRDVVVIQGGLHHLPRLPEDLDRVLSEVRRVLADDGRLVVVEPWRTPFLDLVHWFCRRPLARRAWPKLDALATMIELEIDTYERWLDRPRVVSRSLESTFRPLRRRTGWGKLQFVGRPRDEDRG